MPIGKLTLEITIAHAQSLKDRRQVVRSLKEKLRNRFNLAIAETNQGATLWSRATLEIAVISGSAEMVRQLLEQIDRAAHSLAAGLGAELEDAYAELLDEQAGSMLPPQARVDHATERKADA